MNILVKLGFSSLLLFILSCASNLQGISQIEHKLSDKVVCQMNDIYNPYIEKGFCASEYSIYNVIVGSERETPLPHCSVEDVIMHTHPINAIDYPSGLDCYAWKLYNKMFGNKLYGIMFGLGYYKIYEVTDEICSSEEPL